MTDRALSRRPVAGGAGRHHVVMFVRRLRLAFHLRDAALIGFRLCGVAWMALKSAVCAAVRAVDGVGDDVIEHALRTRRLLAANRAAAMLRGVGDALRDVGEFLSVAEAHCRLTRRSEAAERQLIAHARRVLFSIVVHLVRAGWHSRTSQP